MTVRLNVKLKEVLKSENGTPQLITSLICFSVFKIYESQFRSVLIIVLKGRRVAILHRL